MKEDRGGDLLLKNIWGPPSKLDSKVERQVGELCVLPPKILQLLHLLHHQTPMRQSENAATTFQACCRQDLPVSTVVSSPPALGGPDPQRDLDRETHSNT